MAIDLQGSEVAPSLIGLAGFVLSLAITFWRRRKKVVRPFDYVEYLIAPLIVLIVFCVVYFTVDLQSDYAIGLIILLMIFMAGPLMMLGPVGFAIWFFLVYLFANLGSAALTSIGLACMGLLAGEPVGFALTRWRASSPSRQGVMH